MSRKPIVLLSKNEDAKNKKLVKLKKKLVRQKKSKESSKEKPVKLPKRKKRAVKHLMKM